MDRIELRNALLTMTTFGEVKRTTFIIRGIKLSSERAARDLSDMIARKVPPRYSGEDMPTMLKAAEIVISVCDEIINELEQ